MPTHANDRSELLNLEAVLDLTRRASDRVLPRGVLQAFEVMGMRAAARLRTNWVDALLEPEPLPAS
jgi:hypothetical protein